MTDSLNLPVEDVEARRPSTVAHEAQRLQWLQETNEPLGSVAFVIAQLSYAYCSLGIHDVVVP